MTNATPANDIKPTASKKSAPVMVWEIRSKDRVAGGKTYPGEVTKGHHAEILPGERIRLFGVESRMRYEGTPGSYRPVMEEHLYRVDFKIGDPAVVGGYNLTYTGTIRSITEKTVTVVEYEGTCNEKVHRLSIADFDRKNWDYDAQKIAAHNAAWMD